LFLPELRKCPKAFILNSGSLAGFFPSPYKSVYAASKSFVNMFSLALREELRQSSISVSVLCPGSVLTNDAVKRRVPKNGYFARAALVSSERVARIALNKMEKGKALIIPGFVNKVYYFLGFVFPLKLRAKFLSKLFRKYYLSGNGN
jgi:short-subunit dehydrogenase